MNYKRNQRNYTYNLHGCLKDMDEETGLYYYGMRYYAAWLCRFINVDPLQFKYPYYTPFQYAGNMPITYVDLDGGEPKKFTLLSPQELKNNREPYYDTVDHTGGLGYSIRRVETIPKAQTQSNVKKTPVKFIKPTDLKTEQTSPQSSPDPTGAAGAIPFHFMKFSDIIAIEKHLEMEEKKKWANFNPGEIVPAKSEFERKVDDAYKSTGVFENTYRYDKVFNATAVGLFTTGTIATGAYFAPTLKYSATNLFINSYQSGSTLYNSAAYFSTTTKGMFLQGAVFGVSSTILNLGSPDIEMPSLFSTVVSVPFSFGTQILKDTYYDIINSINSTDTTNIDSTKYKLYQTTLPPIIKP